jgi:hypothetical protein
MTIERIGDERREQPVYTTLPVMRPNGEIAFAVFRQLPEEEYRKHYLLDGRVQVLDGQRLLFLLLLDSREACNMIVQELEIPMTAI